MTGFATEQVLTLIALGLERLGHAVIGFHPVAHHAGVEQVLAADGDELFQADVAKRVRSKQTCRDLGPLFGRH